MARKSKQPTRTVTLARTRLLDVADELDAISTLLQQVPDLTRLASLVHSAHSDAGEPPDSMAEWARDSLRIDLDGVEDDDDSVAFSDLAHVPNAPHAVLDAARWRLARVSRLLALVARHDQRTKKR